MKLKLKKKKHRNFQRKKEPVHKWKKTFDNYMCDISLISHKK